MDIPSVLAYLRPDSEWTLNGDDYAGLKWSSSNTRPTLVECQKAWKEIERDYLMRPIRSQRDALLSASDWTQNPDAPADTKAWASYRQALRDLPGSVEDPTVTIVWPTPPT